MTKFKCVRRPAAFLAALLLAVLLCAAVSAEALPEPGNSFVYDEAGVISVSTAQHIDKMNGVLEAACGAQIVFAVVDFTGSYEIDDYTYELFNKWGIGDKNKNNGLLFVLATGAEDYYAMPGKGLENVFSGSVLSGIYDEYLEADFARGDYDAGVRKTFDRSLQIMAKHYGVSLSDYGYEQPVERERSSFGRVGGVLVGIVAVVLVIVVIRALSSGPRGGGGMGGGGGGGFWSGMMLGSLMNSGRRRRSYYHPPTHHGGFGGFGGFRPPRGGGGFGGFGGGGAGGFGGGRGGGGFSGGGGGTRGGGAGRR